MSLNELAVDLTCEPVAFHPAKTDAETDDTLPRGFSLPNFRHKNSKEHEGSDSENSAYLVHGGMLRMAKAMGDVGNPVHMTVLSALQKNPTYGALAFYYFNCSGTYRVRNRSCVVWSQPRGWCCYFAWHGQLLRIHLNESVAKMKF